jgi:hypothetical protein
MILWSFLFLSDAGEFTTAPPPATSARMNPAIAGGFP